MKISDRVKVKALILVLAQALNFGRRFFSLKDFLLLFALILREFFRNFLGIFSLKTVTITEGVIFKRSRLAKFVLQGFPFFNFASKKNSGTPVCTLSLRSEKRISNWIWAAFIQWRCRFKQKKTISNNYKYIGLIFFVEANPIDDDDDDDDILFMLSNIIKYMQCTVL